MSTMFTGSKAQKEGSRVQQRSQPRQADDESSLLELEVVRRKWCDDNATISRNLMFRGHGQRESEGVQQWSQPRQTDDESGLLELRDVRNVWMT